MNSTSWIKPALVRVGVLVILLGLALPAPLAARPAAAGVRAAWPGPPVHAKSLDGAGNRVMQFIYTTFGRRDRMIQMTAVGVAVGLFVMLRRGKSGV
jgi:hypothetical protein